MTYFPLHLPLGMISNLTSQVEGITVEILGKALTQAKVARRHILAQMERCAPAPRRALADSAPRIKIVSIDPEKVGLLIGPGGRVIRGIVQDSGAEEVQVRIKFHGRPTEVVYHWYT